MNGDMKGIGGPCSIHCVLPVKNKKKKELTKIGNMKTSAFCAKGHTATGKKKKGNFKQKPNKTEGKKGKEEPTQVSYENARRTRKASRGNNLVRVAFANTREEGNAKMGKKKGFQGTGKKTKRGFL